MRNIGLLSLALLASGCVYPEDAERIPVGASNAGVPEVAHLLDQPRLALADHVLAEYFGSDIDLRPTVCLGVSEGGALQALPVEQETLLIARYKSLAPLSRCSSGAAGWIDVESEKPAIVFMLHDFACVTETSCTGIASYTAGQTSSMSYRYTMSYAGGSWSFDRDPRLVGVR